MLAEQIRSGLAETSHEGAVAVVDVDGDLFASHGDIDRPFFIRSSAKPFQAFVSQESGAGLDDLELAMACASHRGFPVHIALVERMLATAGIDESVLICPPSWPLSPVAAGGVQRRGATEKRRVWHNCSGKHAGFVRACVAAGWPIETYASPNHPLQRRVISLVSELGDFDAEPVGVDGCGAPVLRTTARAMATMYARLAGEIDLRPIFDTMHRYPALVGSNGEGDTEMAIAIDAAAKGGAAGCIGVAVDGRLGLAAKSWDGQGVIANLAAAASLRELGVLSSPAEEALDPLIHPVVLGGGSPVGRIEPRVTLELA